MALLFPPATIQVGAHDDARGWLLAGKLGPPRQRVSAALRLALLQRLDRARELPLTVISSPAGFGKSTLLAQWQQRLQQRGEHVAWLSLGEDDGEISRFVAYLVLAVGAAGISVAPLLQTTQAQLHDIDARAAIAALIDVIRAAAAPLVLVLDDYDRVRSKPVDALVLDMLQHADPRLHVVLSGREPPSIPLSRLLAGGLVERIGVEEMALTLQEAEAIFGTRLPVQTLRKLHERTEGWAVALQLAALGAPPGKAATEPLRGFSGRSPEMAAYLAEQVVAHMDPALRGFVLRTSLLERFDAELADAVCGDAGGEARLQQLQALQGLLIALDPESRWFRYHHLFGEYLRAQVCQHYPDEVPALHLQAARALQARGDLLEAVKHALRGGGSELAAEMLAAAGGWALVLQRGLGFVRPLLRHFDRDSVRNSPVLNVTQAYLHIKLGEFEHARELLERFQALPEPARERYRHGYVVVRSLLENYLDETWTDPGRTDRIAAQIPQLAEDALCSATLQCVCTVDELGRGEFDAARGYALAALEGMRQAGSVIGTAYALLHLGQTRFYVGRLDEAEAIYREAMVIAEQYFGVDNALKACGECLLAQLLYQRSDVDQAEAALRSGLPFLEGHDGWLDVFAAAYETRLAIVLQRHALSEALVLLQHFEQVARARRLGRLQALERAWRLQVLLLLPDPTAADLLVADANCEAELELALSQRHYWRQLLALGLPMADWYLRGGRSGQALHLLQRMQQACAEGGRGLHLAQVRLRLALVQQQRGELDAALETLGAALDFVQTVQAWQLAREVRRPLRTLLYLMQQRDRGARPGSARGAALARLLEVGADAGGDGGFSPREREILVELCAGQSNKAIARRLNLSENTVKSHLKSIFRKLGVETRGAAVVQALKQGVAA